MTLLMASSLAACGNEAPDYIGGKPSDASTYLRGMDEFSPQYALQGNASDCWLIAALAAMAQTQPETLSGMIETTGSMTLVVHLSDKDISVTRSDLDHDGAKMVADANGAIVMWPNVMEYAIAHYNGERVDQLGADNATTAFAALGIQSEQVRFEADALGGYMRVISLVNKGYPITLASGPESDAGSPVVDNHTYTLIAVIDLDHVIVRNPWGNNGAGASDDGLLVLTGAQALRYLPRVVAPASAF